ncbi:MAG: tRNA lysidine(34) synthetase TilS [Pseudomonadota bacterium]
MLSAPLIDAISDVIGPNPPDRIGVAVSGGGDSIALLSAMAEYARQQDIELQVITIDHGLRADTRQEVNVVTDLCLKLGLQHHLEYWTGWDGSGNLQAEARGARYALMADWAYANHIGHIALAHTADDQAETVLMRLARSAGVDGLSAMAQTSMRDGITWLRPFLRINRATLRLYLQASGRKWVEDPSNNDRRFDRVRMRDALTVLAALGITVDALCDVAQNQREARQALDWQSFLIARELVEIEAGAVVIVLNRFRAQPVEVKRRLLVHAIKWLTGNAYAPRRDAVMRTLAAIGAGQSATLAGCQITHANDQFWVHREHKAIAAVESHVNDAWDDRWYVDGPEDDDDITVRALGFDVLSEIDGWRDRNIPRAVLAVTPAVWYDNQVLAAPLVIDDAEWSAEVEGGKDGFFAALLSH